MGMLDFLFGAGALKKAAGPDAKDSGPSQPAGLDMAGLAQDSANRQKSQEAKNQPAKSGSPLSSTMTPMAPVAPAKKAN